MIKLIRYTISLVVLSLFFFPFELVAIPGANTKMILAMFGLVILAVNMSRSRGALLNKDFFSVLVISLLVSFIGFFSVIYNNTSDYSYATYFISMVVWMSGAYITIKIMKLCCLEISVRTVCNFLIVLCVAQCLLALLIDIFPVLRQVVSRVMIVTPAMEGRLYGVDASLDIAGTRFSAVLIMITHCCLSESNKWNHLLWYVLAYMIITIVGNMISRTTIVGVILSTIYCVCYGVKGKASNIKPFFITVVCVLLATIPIIITLYKTDQRFYELLRFGFEGFFSLFETGHWETHSNNILLEMIKFPDNLKTWMIGDGYFDNPYHTDPYYIGERTGGFYMATDIGYLRFIFYFGILGLIAFILFFIRVGFILKRRFPSFGSMFVFLVLLNFIVWFKVSTDIFVVFTLFLCLNNSDGSPQLEPLS